jgi:hypothetical protein
MLCNLCKQEIPKFRINHRTKYCSEFCNKKSWYLKNSNQIHQGTKEWSNTATGKGHYWEKWASKILNAKWNNENIFTVKSDLTLYNNETVDVKSSKGYKRKFKRGKKCGSNIQGCYNFNLNNKNLSDYYFLIGYADINKPKCYLIPFDKIKSKSICITMGRSKYDKYLFNY